MNRGRTIAACDQLTDPASTDQSRAGRRSVAGEVRRLFASGWLPILGVLLVWSFLRSPIPSVNEPHYFCKAKHFWNPEWCANDFFLASSNPHFIFYCCFGPMTEFLSLAQTACIARIVSLMILAWGWLQVTAPLLRLAGQQVLALCLFLFLQAMVNFSGEWVVGGAEAKVISYGFGLWALGTWQQNKNFQTALLTGLAVSFHALVGCWLTVAFLMEYGWRHRETFLYTPAQIIIQGIQSWREVSIWIICSLPGLLPSMQLLLSQSDSATKFGGNYLQVYFRLKHHLDPMEFGWWRYVSYALMFVVVVFCFKQLSEKSKEGKEPKEVLEKARILMGVLCVSLLIAGVGVLLGLRFTVPADMPGLRWRIDLLKFYPFRFFDLLTPLIGSIFVVAAGTVFLQKRGESIHPQNRQLDSNKRGIKLHLLSVGLLVIGLCIPFVDHNASRMSANKRQGWLDTCQWINKFTPEETVVITPRCSWAFKWYAQRAEYVTRKDCPQDADGILEWNRRLHQVASWKRSNYTGRLYDEEETSQLARQTGATYLIANRFGPMEIEPVYKNAYFRVYRIDR